MQNAKTKCIDIKNSIQFSDVANAINNEVFNQATCQQFIHIEKRGQMLDDNDEFLDGPFDPALHEVQINVMIPQGSDKIDLVYNNSYNII